MQFCRFSSMMTLENKLRKCKQRAIDVNEVVQMSHGVVTLLSNVRNISIN